MIGSSFVKEFKMPLWFLGRTQKSFEYMSCLKKLRSVEEIFGCINNFLLQGKIG